MIDDEKLAEAYNRGLVLEKTGDLEGAEAAYQEALKIDPSDAGGVSIRLAALGRASSPDKMPDAYVATLFDQNADVFDEILVDELGYCVPLQLRELIRVMEIGPFKRLLDLGCGTGLTGVAFADCASHLTGVDLSERIVELAFDRQVYDDLYVGEAVSFLDEFEDDDGSRPLWDFIAATDVFPYLGDIDPFLKAAVKRLEPGGYLAFSTETLPEDLLAGAHYKVGPKHRFAHDEGYIRGALLSAGLDVELFEPITVRLEDKMPVPGHLVIAKL